MSFMSQSVPSISRDVEPVADPVWTQIQELDFAELS